MSDSWRLLINQPRWRCGITDQLLKTEHERTPISGHLQSSSIVVVRELFSAISDGAFAPELVNFWCLLQFETYFNVLFLGLATVCGRDSKGHFVIRVFSATCVMERPVLNNDVMATIPKRQPNVKSPKTTCCGAGFLGVLECRRSNCEWTLCGLVGEFFGCMAVERGRGGC